MPQRSELVFTVDLCPRCGSQHNDLPFEEMRSAVRVLTDDGAHTSDLDLFATCPAFAEPILGRIVGEGEVEVR